MQPLKTVRRERVLDMGKFLKVERHTVELPDGRRLENWPWIDAPDFVNVIPVTPAGRILCFRQVKYAIDGVTLAPVGGYLEPGEDARAGAERELLEESGCRAADWIELGTYRIDSNRGAGFAHFYLATGAVRVAEPESDDVEEQCLVELTVPQTEAALRRGEFRALPWVAVIALALDRLRLGAAGRDGAQRP